MAVIIGTVNIRHPETLEVVTLLPGEELPEWAEDIITNPKVVAQEAPESEEAPDPSTPAPPIVQAQKPDDLPALRAQAKELGLDARGNADSLRAKIQEHIQAQKAEDDAAAEAAAGESEQNEGAGEPEHVDLHAKATELGLEFDEETTDAELELLIASKE